MNNVKTKFTVFFSLVLAVVCLSMMFGCGGDPVDQPTSTTEVFIEKSLQPRLLYVEGQELDLTKGALTAVKDGEQIRVPLNDAAVSVTGYDKNKIGNQTLTVTYDGKSTTLTVGVIARMVVENVESSYFTGEKFNSAKGRVKIANDNAETSYVNMNSEFITVKSFDSSNSGKVPVTIEYREGDTAYECTFNVDVYEPDTISFTKPKKNEYLNHEKELNLAGGYLSIKAKSPSTFSKSISLTADMTSGYDPDAVTKADKGTPVSQTVTVTYAGREWTFPITVSYSGVYIINDNADKIEGINLEVEDISTIKIPTAAGEAAKEAISEYLLLSYSDKQLLDADLVLTYAKIAAFYVNTVDYINANNELSDAFIYTANGQLGFVGKTYEAIEKAIEALNDPDSNYNKSASFLLAIKEEFGDEQFNATYKISSLTSVHTPEIAESISARLEHILAVYDALKAVPSDWKSLNSEEFYAYETNVFAAVNNIRQSEFKGPAYSGMYKVISNWRPDFFEIIYSYYYYVAEDGQEKIVKNLWGVVPAPGLLQDFYVMYNNAYTQVNLITQNVQNNPANVFMYDLYQFHYYYMTTLKIADQIMKSGNELYTTIYNAIGLDAYVEIYLRAPSANIIGYYDFMGAGMNNEKIKATFDAYWEILDVYYKEGQLAATESNKQKIAAIFTAMTELSPSELHWFLSSISFKYHNSRGSLLIFDYSAGSRNLLVSILASYYLTELPQNDPATTAHKTHTMFANLLLAMESYSLSFYKEGAIEDFKTYMNNIATDYNLLSGEDQNAFNNLLGNCYKKYFDIKKHLEDQSLINVGSASEKIDELLLTLKKFDEMYQISLDATNPNQQNSYIMMIALHNKATAIYNELYLEAESNSALKYVLYSKLYEINEDTTDTIEKYYYDVCATATDMMLVNNVWLANELGSVKQFTNLILPLMMAEFEGKLYEGDIEALIAAFRALKADDKYGVYTIQVNKLFYAALERYFNTLISEEAKTAGIMADLFNAEIYYSLYELDKNNAEALDTFKSSMASAIEKYASLSENDKKAIEDIYYNIYLEKYNALPSDETV